MKIKDQIRARREQLDISVVQLAERLGTSDQTVRYWESGRSRPNKHMIQPLEQALSFTIDFHEGESPTNPFTAQTLNEEGVEMAIQFAKLPVDVRRLFKDLASRYQPHEGEVAGSGSTAKKQASQQDKTRSQKATNVASRHLASHK
jgi:transcriptional regulator with XRE-family HTH domain